MRGTFLLICLALVSQGQVSQSQARDVFLTIGGGYEPAGNQASIENNVLYAQRILADRPKDSLNHIYFADGLDSKADVEVLDRGSVPKANRYMAEFFGSSSNLGLSYRNHRVPGVRGPSTPASIREWFRDVGSRLIAGDRLILYVTAHGGPSRDRNDEYETTIAMWNNTALRMSELVQLMDKLPPGVEIVCIMVQCHAGGFARMIFEGGDPDAGLSPRKRVGFFATVHDRQAAGCTAEADEESYVEYSTFFWAALSGFNRMGDAIESPDYDEDGRVSFEEAHAYVLLTADTIDLPLKTSGEYLTKWGRYGERKDGLLPDDAKYSEVLAVATRVQRAILEGLSDQLDLKGEDRIMDAYEQSKSDSRSRTRGRRTPNRQGQLRTKISRELKERWPGLANVMNPVSIELITNRQAEFIGAVEQHGDYAEYRTLAEREVNSQQKTRVKYERFLRTVDNVIFAENLRRRNKTELLSQYESIVEAERGTLFN